MQSGGMSIAAVPSGSDGASTSTAQAASMTTKGVASASSIQGASLVSRGGASTSGSQINPLPPRGGIPTSAFIVASNAPQVVASTSGFQGAVNPSRQRFYVELKEGETNVVSWKKLVKDAQKNAVAVASEAPAGANPALEARIAPERAGLTPTNVAVPPEPLPAPTNRFSSVIEKIERLYKGVDSEEEDGGYASIDESQYDSDDGFIDDTELNEYFSVDTAKTKHTGFFVNRGKLEKVDESPPPPLPPPPTAAHVPRKRKRNITKLSSEIVAGEFAKKRVNIGLRLKDAARKTPGPIAPVVEASPSSPVKTSEQSAIPKPQKRVQPILDERENNVETAWLSAEHTMNDHVKDSGKVDEFKKDSDSTTETTVVELSDDESDGLVEVLRPKGDAKDRGGPDVSVPNNRVAVTVTESTVAPVSERNNTSKSASESIEELPATDDSRETGGFATPPKIRKNQQLLKDDELKEPEGGKTLSASVTSSPGNKDVSPKKVAGWPKGTVLERAINDLEKGVTEAFPLTGDRQEAIEKAESGGKSKRLPREVKQKLAKVARLAAKKGKIPDEFIERLMNIIGHVMRLKTLKRNLKSMVEMGLNAKQAKDVRLQDMKREVTELVKSRVATFRALDAEQPEGYSDDFQATTSSMDGTHGGLFKWDEATEDRICDLYDHYVEGMDEHKGPQIRKLYIELADLWPEGWMDNHGIKNAVFRAKERRKKQNKLKMGEEKRKKKAALVTEKQKADRETVVTERKTPSPPPPAFVPLLNKGVPQKEKLTIKSSKQRVDDTVSKYTEERSKHGDAMEEARRLAVGEIVRRNGLEHSMKMKLTEKSATRDHGISGSQLLKSKPILKREESLKGKRAEDGSQMQRKLPRKSFEGKIVEHLARKRPRNENAENDSVEIPRSSKNALNSPLMKVKKKRIRPSSDGKPSYTSDGRTYISPRIGPSPVRVSSNSDRLVNGAHTLKSKVSGIAPVRGGEPARVKDIARWPSEASRLGVRRKTKICPGCQMTFLFLTGIEGNDVWLLDLKAIVLYLLQTYEIYFTRKSSSVASLLVFWVRAFLNSSGDFVGGLELPLHINYLRRAIITLCERVMADFGLDIAQERRIVAPQSCGFYVHDDNVGKRDTWVKASHLLDFCRFEKIFLSQCPLALGDKTVPVKILLTI